MKTKNSTPITYTIYGFFLLSTLLGTPVAKAACSKTALQAARTFFTHHYQFWMEKPNNLRQLVTPSLRKLLIQEQTCSAAPQICAIDADPWLDAQDGEARHAEFSLTEDGHIVKINYLFTIESEAQKRTAYLHLTRMAGCWRVSDLVGPEGRSLHHALENYYEAEKNENH